VRDTYNIQHQHPTTHKLKGSLLELLPFTISLIAMNLVLCICAVCALLLNGASFATVQGTLHRRDYFYVGQQYSPLNDSFISHGQVYVEHLTPVTVIQPFPLLFIHGKGMTGTNFLNTPDGRLGWADKFLSLGYEIYIVDQPSRARSPWIEGIDGELVSSTTQRIESHFTATELYQQWPQAILHTQWPGNGTKGDPIFDAFFASTVPSLVSEVESSQDMLAAGPLLLDLLLKPAILITHSQSGQYGWILGDARPSKVKAIIAIEPIGPPFIDAVFDTDPARSFGVTEIPLKFSPPINSAADLQPVVISNDTDTSFSCFQLPDDQQRNLTNLMDIPVLIVTAESSYHAVYDECTVEFLQRASVPVHHVYLGDVGIHGNGHMMFLEKNSDDIANEILLPFIQKFS
jgi:pimeloyl-ACP methyl ester carboxylesterase